MTQSSSPQSSGPGARRTGPSLLFRLLAFLVLAAGTLFLLLTGLVPLAWPQQVVLGLTAVLFAVWFNRLSASPSITLTLTLLAIFVTFRYAVWRIGSVLQFFRPPLSLATLPSALLVALLLLAEGYVIALLLLGFFQAASPLRRLPVPLPADPRRWPSADLLIPAHREPLSLIRSTALAAVHLDWPADKLNVYLLDDGHRPELRLFAEQAGIGYLTRPGTPNGWAGNINHALAQLRSPLLAVFHAGHVPTRSFLQVTLGGFLCDTRLGLLQTASASRSPLGQGTPTLAQTANDTWNATVFTGSAAVLRRAALDRIGGIPVETTAAGPHTSLRMQRDGWQTAYLDLPQAAPSALSSLAGQSLQRARWNRGIRRIMRLEQPLLASGLTLSQRLCTLYTFAQTLSALPRLIFLAVPPVCLIFGCTGIPGFWAAILAYALPYLALVRIATNRRAGQNGTHKAQAFWFQIHEIILASQLFRSGVPPPEETDRASAPLTGPLTWLLALNLLGLLTAIPRLVFVDLPFLQTLCHQTPVNALVINLLLTAFNLILLAVATAVAAEPSPEPGSTVAASVDVILPGGPALTAVTAYLTEAGAAIPLGRPLRIDSFTGASIQLAVPVPGGKAILPAILLGIEANILRAEFAELTLAQHEDLTLALYARADRWLPREGDPVSRPSPGLFAIARLALRGIRHAVQGTGNNPHPAAPRRFATSIAPLILLATLAHPLRAGQADPRPTVQETASLAGNLNLLPLPFFDPAVVPPATIPIVFLRQPSPSALRAAAIVASWFGILAEAQPARFAVSVASIPTGNAILLAENPADLPTILNLFAPSAPIIALRPNPADPEAKLLILTGPQSQDLIAAAQVLALQPAMLAGDTITLRAPRSPTPRQPDDAPRWLSTGKITHLSEILDATALQSDGTHLISIPIHLPPDLDTTHLDNLPLHLDYRYNGIPLSQGSTLQLFLNSAYISSVPLPHVDHASARLQTIVPVPVSALRPSYNLLQAQFVFQTGGSSQSPAPPNLMGAILKDSFIDLTGVSHWTTLPNLQLFARAGYPFTRLADLAGTTVVLPAVPTPAEIELFLTLMGHFGAQTGYPVLSVQVTGPEGLQTSSRRDYLVLGDVEDQPALRQLSPALPLQIHPSGLVLSPVDSDADGIFVPLASFWNRLRGRTPAAPIFFETHGPLPDAILEAIEWPRSSSHSTVVLAVRDQASFPAFLEAFLAAGQTSDLTQSVGILRGSRFTSTRLGTQTYMVGTLSGRDRLPLFVEQYPWAAMLSITLVCILMAAILGTLLRQHALVRLEGDAWLTPSTMPNRDTGLR